MQVLQVGTVAVAFEQSFVTTPVWRVCSHITSRLGANSVSLPIRCSQIFDLAVRLFLFLVVADGLQGRRNVLVDPAVKLLQADQCPRRPTQHARSPSRLALRPTSSRIKTSAHNTETKGYVQCTKEPTIK